MHACNFQILIAFHSFCSRGASKGRKYVPLNSLTLSRHTGGDSASENEGQKTEHGANADDMKPQAKRPWWQSLPPNKNKKNKVILDEYDKLKSSLPKWPWIEALKSSTCKPSISIVKGHDLTKYCIFSFSW